MGYKDPGKAANKYYSQIPGTMTPYYQPYIDAGNQSMGTLSNQYNTQMGNYQPLQDQYNTMMNNPSQIISNLGAGFQESPGYQYTQQQAAYAGNNAAAAGGMAGSPQHQQYAQETAGHIADQEFNNYMKQALGIYDQGISGNQNFYDQALRGNQDFSHMGYSASNELAQSLANALMSQGNLAYSSAANQNQRRGGMMGSALGAAGSILGFL